MQPSPVQPPVRDGVLVGPWDSLLRITINLPNRPSWCHVPHVIVGGHLAVGDNAGPIHHLDPLQLSPLLSSRQFFLGSSCLGEATLSILAYAGRLAGAWSVFYLKSGTLWLLFPLLYPGRLLLLSRLLFPFYGIIFSSISPETGSFSASTFSHGGVFFKLISQTKVLLNLFSK
ncbi:unnamed protein product [Cuscuta europaea]|uniref:Uncharacterized protein n=1 Tax=Cuscuta europaea TaxID=41803 RepID=A0A9P0ZIK2_CUSEU|nr:unnamed protein product [Cuscuta europaea]